MTTPAAAPGGPDDLTPAERASPHVRSLVRYSWLVLLIIVAAVAASVEITKKEVKRYDATASVLLTNSEPVNVLLKSTGLPSGDPERDLNTDVALVKTNEIAARVKQKLGLPWSTTTLLREVNAQLSGTSNVVEITARDTSPARAAAIANAFATRYITFRRQSAQASYAAAADLAQQRYAALPPALRTSKLAASLRSQQLQLQTAGELQTGASQLVDIATAPTTPATPRPKFDAAVAGLAGLLIGCLLAISLGAIRKQKPATAAAQAGDETGRASASAETDSGLTPERAAATATASASHSGAGGRRWTER